ncbi:hypothetical protein HY415_02610 [Candidatus Kaiserbacteria bacterium]|nr:hypothetical protein [Candidatus Kaiserbacteria bacterium]
MKTVFEHIKHIKGKPHHVRKKIAFATAAGGTGVIALIWFVSSISTGAFAIGEGSFADIAGPGGVEAVNGQGTPRSLAGAAAALNGAGAPAHIEIVDTASSTRQPKKAEQTTIPF